MTLTLNPQQFARGTESIHIDESRCPLNLHRSVTMSRSVRRAKCLLSTTYQFRTSRFSNSMVDAQVGTLVQIASTSIPPWLQYAGAPEAEVGLRSNLDAAGQQLLGVVLLEGALAGLFLRDEQISNAHAVDVDSLACIPLHDPTPRPYNSMSLAVSLGDVIEGQDSGYRAISLHGDCATSRQPRRTSIGFRSPGSAGRTTERTYRQCYDACLPWACHCPSC